LAVQHFTNDAVSYWMKIFILSLCFLLTYLLTIGQTQRITPVGTLKINDTLYADETEIANIHWREFLMYLLSIKKDTLLYEKMLPDTLVWNIDSELTSVEYYLRHPSFGYYPVVGVTYEQALEYCRWRTYAANLAVYWKENKIRNPKPDSAYKFPLKFYYRLPSPQEFNLLLKPGIDSSNRYFRKWIKRDSIWSNTKESYERYYKISSRPPLGPAPIKSFFTNKFGLFNIIGNVAELTSEKGVAKGGGFIHPLPLCNYPNSQLYTKPEKWLGFRCVAVLLK
jgi:formylglycine-generating enzyme required for sulfatase activity